MKLIADSGSTKCFWALVSEGKQIESIYTNGINPFYQTPDEIKTILSDNLCPLMDISHVKEVHFYGAGCAFPEQITMIHEILTSAISGATIEVNSDLLAVARGSCGNEEGISCILGTGSNSCFYDGRKIIKNVSPLGYILGDEGSGAVIGKLFIGDLLKNMYSFSLHQEFMDFYETSPSEIMQHVYKKPFPNRYLAQFTKFIALHLDDPQLYNLVYNSFANFILRNVMQYDYKSYPVYFTGSIAWKFADILREVCLSNGILPADIQQNPMEGLIEYHENFSS